MNDLCSIELLRNAVTRGLSANEEATLHAHLEHCETCCAQMEQLAGGEAWQQETAALLSADELDAAVPDPAVWSDVDFSVEHLDPSHDANVLGQLGGYDVLAIVGRGGMGIVLKAFDHELKRFVAIKVLAPHLAHSSVARKRFAREAQAAAAVVHPHVIAIHQVQPTGRLPFLIMPLLTGESLAQRLKARGPLELTEVLRIGMQAAAGLAAAHQQGLVHRDVKPANIFLEKGVERVVITDFGLARAADDVSMTRLGVVAGTPAYMSPEQARGEALDGRSDLFSVGCVLYEMATGVSPFRADSTIATLRRIVEEQPVAMASLCPELPPWFNTIVERLLSKDPTLRFASASEVSELLEQCLSHLQQPNFVSLPVSLVPHVTDRRSHFYSRRKGTIAVLGSCGVALLGMALWQATDAPDISGQWTSEEWGTVFLEPTSSGQYEGTITHSDNTRSDVVSLEWSKVKHHFNGIGHMNLKWSRIERRFNGTWGDGDHDLGNLWLLLVGSEIRGAWTADHNFQQESGCPRSANLLWSRRREVAGRVRAPPDNPRVVKFVELDVDQDGSLNLAEFGVGRTPADAERWFGRRDADLDGLLSLGEFVPQSATAAGGKQLDEKQTESEPTTTDPRERLETAIPEAIRLLKAKEYTTFLKDFLSPADFREISQKTGFSETEFSKQFGEKRAPQLLAILLLINKVKPTFDPNGTIATYEWKDESSGTQKFSFEKVDKYWYMLNKPK